MKYITTDIRDNTGIITLNNPDKRNALGNEMSLDITAALKNFRETKLLTVIIRAEAGAKVWSAGHDVSELPHGGEDPLAYDTPMEQMLRAIESYPGVVIALIQGSVWGGACDMAMTCDIIIADETASAGNINHFVKSAEIENYTLTLTHEINGYSPMAIGIIKEQMRILFRATPISPDAFEQIDQLRRTVYCSQDYEEGLAAFQQKRKPLFKGK